MKQFMPFKRPHIPIPFTHRLVLSLKVMRVLTQLSKAQLRAQCILPTSKEFQGLVEMVFVNGNLGNHLVHLEGSTGIAS
jgi:hypothetical protein